jgi:hypothetical protein
MGSWLGKWDMGLERRANASVWWTPFPLTMWRSLRRQLWVPGADIGRACRRVFLPLDKSTGANIPSSGLPSAMNSERRGLVAGMGCLGLVGLVGCAGPAVDRAGVALPRPSRISDQQAGEAAFLALGLVGTPYRYGGNTPESGFDCSGLIGYVYQRSAEILVPRTVAQISRWGQSIGATAVRAGDLVIFGSNGVPSHAAIHAGESRFVHAPSTGGTVRLNTVNELYWKTRLLDYRRA